MKKLSLNKEFITSLDKFEMTYVHGGNVGNGTTLMKNHQKRTPYDVILEVLAIIALTKRIARYCILF